VPSPTSVTVQAPAKINLSLTVGPPRADGYHELATVFQAIGLYDEVTATPAPEGHITLRLAEEPRSDLRRSGRLGDRGVGGPTGGNRRERADVPTDDRNLAVRAARLLARHTGTSAGAHLRLGKSIPVAGGLAGGSADAAAALVACDALWATGLSAAALVNVAAEVGSDVPFCLIGGTAVGTGRGERLAPVPVRGLFHWVLAVHDEGLSTPAVYAELDRLRTKAGHTSLVTSNLEVPDGIVHALRDGDVEALGQALVNDLQPAALALLPDLDKVLDLRVGVRAAGAIVSGSGPTCVFLAHDEEHARDMCRALCAAGYPALHAAGPMPGARVVDTA
jgi:4-diphosphocytidyl-2-C-methyl-D-erythritol kinase